MNGTSPLPRGAVVGRLRAAGCVFAEDEADLIIDSAHTPEELEALVGQRVSGTPLEHLLGWATFAGLRVAVDPGVFVPRRRTELLAAEAVRLARPGEVVVDLCSGAGAVALVLARSVPGLEVHAVDVDPAAVACAARNLGPAGGHVHQGDLYSGLPGWLRRRISVITANTPYVPTDALATMPAEARDHEPRLALDGGPDGLDVQRGVVGGAREWLVPGGHLLVETSRRQAEATRALMSAQGLRSSVVRSDTVDATVVVARLDPGT